MFIYDEDDSADSTVVTFDVLWNTAAWFFSNWFFIYGDMVFPSVVCFPESVQVMSASILFVIYIRNNVYSLLYLFILAFLRFRIPKGTRRRKFMLILRRFQRASYSVLVFCHHSVYFFAV